MIVGVPSESAPGERRVALVPAAAQVLKSAGCDVLVEKGAGERAGFADEDYTAHGARIAPGRAAIFGEAGVILQVRAFAGGPGDLDLARPGQIVIGLLDPLGRPELAREMAGRKITAFALELLPRISRAQSMDALSSMATVAGYKAALVAAASLRKMFPMMITAAGTVAPAKVFVIGAGVAGLQAIATAHRLGAQVNAYDVRSAVREQVESVGGRFVDLGLDAGAAETKGGYAKALGEEFYRRQREAMANVVAESDVVITTAAVPGRKAPLLVTEDAVRRMHPGSVIVDLAASGGGNCELTKPGETVEVDGVTIIGTLDLESSVANHASLMYAKNISTFLKVLLKDGEIHLDMDDPIVRDSLLTHEGEVANARVREMLGMSAAAMSATV